MTAKEIRETSNSVQDDFWLKEIAAQLAEIKEELSQLKHSSIFEQVFGK